MKMKIIKVNLYLFFVLFVISGSYAQTTINGSFFHDGIERTYRAYVPAMYNPTIAVPLLFNLHGFGSNNIEQEVYGDFRPIADTAGAVGCQDVGNSSS